MLTEHELLELCGRVTSKLVSRYKWTLLEPDDFVNRVFERAKAQKVHTVSGITRIAKNVYSIALYEACGSDSGLWRQRAYEDLGRIIYDIARQRRPECPTQAEEATQKALLDTYRGRMQNKCRSPGSFLAFVIAKVRGALTWVGRGKQRVRHQPLSLEELEPQLEEGEFYPSWHPSPKRTALRSPEEAARRLELAQAVRAELGHKFRIHRRAKEQLYAAILRYAYEKDIRQICDLLGKPSPRLVSTLVSRGLKKLRGNKGLEQLALQMSLDWMS